VGWTFCGSKLLERRVERLFGVEFLTEFSSSRVLSLDLTLSWSDLRLLFAPILPVRGFGVSISRRLPRLDDDDEPPHAELSRESFTDPDDRDDRFRRWAFKGLVPGSIEVGSSVI
jgi:hypothetical protein